MDAQAIANAIATFREKLEARVEVCDLYLRPSNCAVLSGNNTAVVSTLWNGRGVITVGKGQAIAPYPNGNPALWAPGDAATLVAAFNKHLEDSGSEERVFALGEREFWAAARQDALRSLAQLDEALSA